MTLPVSDARSNHPDQIAYIAKVLGKSKDRLKVFLFIHKGKKKFKTASDIAKGTGMRRKRVLEGKKLVHKEVVKQDVGGGEIGYIRDAFSYANQKRILSLATNPKKLAAFPTKYSPKIKIVRVSAPKALIQTATVTVDAIDSFSRVKGIRKIGGLGGMSESRFKKGIQRVVGEKGVFKDWGGETSDLWTTRVRHKGRRVAAAFAFKGPGMSGLLVPGKLGKNGDQIQRLFAEDADVFFVQYVGQIAPTVIQQMAVFAQAKSLSTGRKIYYGVIDGQDSARIVAAYSKAFK